MLLCLVGFAVPTLSIAQETLGVQWATFLGGSGDDQMRDMCIDKADNVYVCGVFTSPDFPKPVNAPTSFDTTGPGGYLASFGPNGELRWLQYFACVEPHEVAISELGVLVMVGSTAERCGNVSAVVATFTSFGARLTGEVNLDGKGTDIATSVDIVGNTIYIGGITDSQDFPVTLNANQVVYQGDGSAGEGKGDGFVAKGNIVTSASGPQLQFDVVTYFGGRFLDEVLVVRARESLGGVYIGGRTRSDKLPGASFVQSTRSGSVYDDDGFVSVLDSGTLVARWSMFCGGRGNDVVYGLQTVLADEFPPFNNGVIIRVCGVYNGGDFIIPGQPGNAARFAGGSPSGGDAFYFEVAERYQTVVSVRQVSTTADDIATSFPRSSFGKIGPLLFSDGQVAGLNPTSLFDAFRWNAIAAPGVEPTLQEYRGSGNEVTLDSAQVRFGFGGNDEGPNSSYICGSTNSILIPGTNAPFPIYQMAKRGNGRNGFLAKIGCNARTVELTATDSILCAPGDSSVLTLQPSPSQVRWQDGVTASTRSVFAPGRYQVTYIDGGCDVTNVIEIRAGVIPTGNITPADTVRLCDSASVVLTINSNNRVQRAVWSNGVATEDTTLLVREPGAYSALLFSADGCAAVTNTVIVVPSSWSGTTPLIASFVGADSASVGSNVRVALRAVVPASVPLEQLPLEWSAVIRFDKTMLYPVRPLGRGTTDDSLRSITLTGRRKASSDTLGLFELRVALGDQDSTAIIIDSLVFDPCNTRSARIELPFRTAGICRIDSTERLITFARSRMAIAVASNPVGPDGAIASVVGDGVSSATARIVSILGQEIQLGTGESYGDTVDWTIPSWLPAGTYVFIVQSQTSTASALFEVTR